MNYKSFPLGALWTNGYLFWDDETSEAFFVDPGGDMKEVKAFIADHGLKLTMILLTHGHIDHIAGIHELTEYVGDNVYIGSKDAYSLAHPSTRLQALLGVHCKGLAKFKEVDEGRIIEFPGYTIKVIETPGHTRGSRATHFLRRASDALTSRAGMTSSLKPHCVNSTLWLTAFTSSRDTARTPALRQNAK